jgi:hypothetical protein
LGVLKHGDEQVQATTAVASGEAPVSSIPHLRGTIHSDPILAIQLLPRFTAPQLSELSARDLSDLLKNIHKVSREDPRIASASEETGFTEPLSILRGLLYDLPSATGKNDAHLGKRFKRDLLGRFLRACTILNCDSLLRFTLKERLEAQDSEGEMFVLPDIWSTALASRRKWNLIIDLLSPSAFPVHSFTPYSIYRLMQAHLALGMAHRVPTIFRMYSDLGITPPARAYPSLVQAHLTLGDMDAARQVMQQSMSDTPTDNVANQLAITKGYRELGRDKALEGRVLEATEGMEHHARAAILHALIRLRLDKGDTDGAKDLLSRFDCGPWSERGVDNPSSIGTSRLPTRLEADAQTHLLAFRALAPSFSIPQLEEAWRYLTVVDLPVTDELIIILMRNLARLDSPDIAQALVASESSASRIDASFVLPDDYTPSASVLNTLLDLSSRAEGWRGIEESLKLFRARGIKPDSGTLTIVLTFIRDNVTSDPTALANLANAILRHSPDIKPTIDHIDLLLGQAVQAQARATQLAAAKSASADKTLDPADENSTTPDAGLNTRDPFKYAVRSIVRNLRARGVRSMSRSLATRLRFDAQSHTRLDANDGSTIHAAPSVKAVWDEMMTRGYKPDKRHFLAMMKGYADSGHMAECEDVIILARDNGMEPTRGMWMVLLTAYGQVRRSTFDLIRAEKAFDAIRQCEQGLDLPAACAMIGIYQRTGHRQSAVVLALQLVNNLFESDSVPATPSEEVRASQSTQLQLPAFSKSQFTDRGLAITTDALRLDHPLLALQVISNIHSPPEAPPTRVRDVVKSIRNRARARIVRGIATPIDYEALAHAENLLRTKAVGGRTIGPKGVRKKVLRLFERRERRGSGGRRLVTIKEEKRQRGEAVRKAAAAVE